jgi:hypothetical protein
MFDLTQCSGTPLSYSSGCTAISWPAARRQDDALLVPLQVVFEHIEHVDYIEEQVRQEAEKLEQFYDHIMVRAVIARPQHNHQKGDTYSVRLHLTVPGAKDITVSRDPAVT